MKNNQNYYSFLVCYHESITSIYVNGLPIAHQERGEDLKMEANLPPLPQGGLEKIKQDVVRILESLPR